MSDLLSYMLMAWPLQISVLWLYHLSFSFKKTIQLLFDIFV